MQTVVEVLYETQSYLRYSYVVYPFADHVCLGDVREYWNAS